MPMVNSRPKDKSRECRPINSYQYNKIVIITTIPTCYILGMDQFTVKKNQLFFKSMPLLKKKHIIKERWDLPYAVVVLLLIPDIIKQ